METSKVNVNQNLNKDETTSVDSKSDQATASSNAQSSSPATPTKPVLTGFEFCIDRGGTFTDVFCRTPTGKTIVMKLLSEDPRNYDDAPREAIRRILSEESGRTFAKGELIDAELIKSIRMGTTVATNALLERKGEPIALLITKGFRDLLYIGNQARPNIFDLRIDRPEVLYKEVVEVDERVLLQRDDCGLGVNGKVIVGQTGEKVVIEVPLDEKKLIQQLRRIKEQQIGSLAVALMHSYTYPKHEQLIKQLAIKLGFKHITLSSEVMPMVKLVQRGNTTCVDAYLTPHIHRYIHSFASGFRLGLHKLNVLFMQSDGGLAPVSTFSGCRAILSGPAGGVVGFTRTCIAEFGKDRRISTALHAIDEPAERSPQCASIGFDMGGTSTDVYRYNGSELEHSYETSISGIPIQCPQLDITTVAAGGGSVLRVRNGLFVVGPESAGAYPGPICYRNYGNDLTVTDANVLLGRLLPEYFPAIFGPGKNEPLNKEMVVMVFESLAEEIRCRNISYSGYKEQGNNQREITREEVALGFVRVANEAMCRAIRNITQGKGYDTSTHLLCCFGGAGAQHACSVARNLGIKKVFIHKYASILSAYGMGLANVVNEQQEPCNVELCETNFSEIDARFDALKSKCRDKLMEQGFTDSNIDYELYLNMRYDKTDFALMVKPHTPIPFGIHHTAPADQRNYCKFGDFRTSFICRYKQEFGFTMGIDQPIMVDDIRVRGIGISDLQINQNFDGDLGHVAIPKPDSLVQCYFEQGYLETAVFKLEQLRPGMKIHGPIIVIDDNSTILVEPFCVLEITRQSNLLIHTLPGAKPSIDIRLDPILLSIFSHRFMSIAEQMGRVLQRTAISTNIKERMDFSCALFDQKGRLVSNAPHIPVHLGSMQEAVMYHLNREEMLFKEGDVILTNSPEEGGTHLPDLTVITPVFYRGSSQPVFFVASRGHHADIGGLTPGSMPPNSTRLIEEGTEFCSFLLVKSGKFQLEDLIEKFKEPGKYPGLSGCRTIQDNINDLKAQVAANQKGISLVCELIDYYGLDVVQAYMSYIQENAADSVRSVLKNLIELSKQPNPPIQFHESWNKSCMLCAEDYLDDGSRIKLKVSISPTDYSVVFDFSESDMQVYGNWNAPRSVTKSAVIYALRCMVSHDIPLNQGCLNNVDIVLKRGSILDPSPSRAVVGGNVLTSQRIVDVIFRAFQTCSASQGCMNNITFGDETFGYYETVAGGAGAGPNWNGQSAVHTHMTNTRITDPEILERRYPVVLKEFSVRRNSGGRGEFNGGDGVIRVLRFRTNLVLSVLTERRVFAPFGLKGGEAGQKGANYLKAACEDRLINLGSKATVNVVPGDEFILKTPGGGAYGEYRG